jgi:ADP-ribosyl-[dinitrogen reductase] hydrolase
VAYLDLKNRFRGCLIGLACGDALGAPVEFLPRGTFPPVETLTGGGKFQLKPGEWTDDTSMALCLASSLIEKQAFDPENQMQKYLKWAEDGYLSCKDYCFGMGKTVFQALVRYKKTGAPYSGNTDPKSAGNGCVMRLAPVVLFYYPDHQSVVHFSGESSKTTHGALECIDACRLFGNILFKALSGHPKSEILSADPFFESPGNGLCRNIQKIANGNYKSKSSTGISGSGYVVESLEAALWCFYTTETFKEAVLKAVNLGQDADTTAAICGQLAGAYYGIDGISKEWIEKIAMNEFILKSSDALLR